MLNCSGLKGFALFSVTFLSEAGFISCTAGGWDLLLAHGKQFLITVRFAQYFTGHFLINHDTLLFQVSPDTTGSCHCCRSYSG